MTFSGLYGKKNVDSFCHLQSQIEGVVTIVLKIAAVNG